MVQPRQLASTVMLMVALGLAPISVKTARATDLFDGSYVGIVRNRRLVQCRRLLQSWAWRNSSPGRGKSLRQVAFANEVIGRSAGEWGYLGERHSKGRDICVSRNDADRQNHRSKHGTGMEGQILQFPCVASATCPADRPTTRRNGRLIGVASSCAGAALMARKCGPSISRKAYVASIGPWPTN